MEILGCKTPISGGEMAGGDPLGCPKGCKNRWEVDCGAGWLSGAGCLDFWASSNKNCWNFLSLFDLALSWE